ncbi:acyltransferase [Providencia sp. PROV144]|uniref:acyltransferase n=1 Tax=Providencia sp. PROV144 TaxID=2949854 RepID=UPI00234A6B9F|nr:acyltransferase [Providencia sp. PROV144]
MLNKLILKTLKLFSYKKYLILIGLKYGRNCQFNKSTNFGSEPYLITIGDNFYSSTNVTFITHDGAINVVRNINEKFKNADIIKPISVGNNVFIGYSSTILPGTIIEDNIIIGAGSIVKGNLKGNSIYAGIPAKRICSLEEYITKNEKDIFLTKGLSPQDKRKFLVSEFK